MPWRSTETEARALKEGFAEADAFWQMLWWGILADVPTGLDRIDCPVVLAQGTADLVAVGQTPRFLAGIRGAGSCRCTARAMPPSPTPRRHPWARQRVHRRSSRTGRRTIRLGEGAAAARMIKINIYARSGCEG